MKYSKINGENVDASVIVNGTFSMVHTNVKDPTPVEEKIAVKGTPKIEKMPEPKCASDSTEVDELMDKVRSCRIAREDSDAEADQQLTKSLSKLTISPGKEQEQVESQRSEQKQSSPQEDDERGEESGEKHAKAEGEKKEDGEKEEEEEGADSSGMMKLDPPVYGAVEADEEQAESKAEETPAPAPKGKDLSGRGPSLGVATQSYASAGYRFIEGQGYAPEHRFQDFSMQMPKNFPDYSNYQQGMCHPAGPQGVCPKREVDMRETHNEPLKYKRPQSGDLAAAAAEFVGGSLNNLSEVPLSGAKKMSNVFQKQMSGGTVYTADDSIASPEQVVPGGEMFIGINGQPEWTGESPEMSSLELPVSWDGMMNIPINVDELLGIENLQQGEEDPLQLPMDNLANGAAGVMGQMSQQSAVGGVPSQQQVPAPRQHNLATGALPPVNTLRQGAAAPNGQYNHHQHHNQQQQQQQQRQQPPHLAQQQQQQQQQQRFQQPQHQQQFQHSSAAPMGGKLQQYAQQQPQQLSQRPRVVGEGVPVMAKPRPKPSFEDLGYDSDNRSPLAQDTALMSSPTPSPDSVIAASPSPSNASPPRPNYSPPPSNMSTSSQDSGFCADEQIPEYRSPFIDKNLAGLSDALLIASKDLMEKTHVQVGCPKPPTVAQNHYNGVETPDPPAQIPQNFPRMDEICPDLVDMTGKQNRNVAVYPQPGGVPVSMGNIHGGAPHSGPGVVAGRPARQAVDAYGGQNLNLSGQDKKLPQNKISSVMPQRSPVNGQMVPQPGMAGQPPVVGVPMPPVQPVMGGRMPPVQPMMSGSMPPQAVVGGQMPPQPVMSQQMPPQPIMGGQMPPQAAVGQMVPGGTLVITAPTSTPPVVNKDGKIAIPPWPGNKLRQEPNRIVSSVLIVSQAVNTPLNKPRYAPIAPKAPPDQASSEAGSGGVRPGADRPPVSSPSGTNGSGSPRAAPERPQRSGKKKQGSPSQMLNLARRVVADMKRPDIDHVDKDGDTYLHIAVVDQDVDQWMVQAILERLVREGLTGMIDRQNSMGQTPLYLAVSTNNPDKVLCLLKHNADVNSFAKRVHPTGVVEQSGAIHCASSNGASHLDTLTALMSSQDIDLNQVNSEGHTALHCAILSHGKSTPSGVLDSVPIIQALMRGGADPNLQVQKNGKTALMYALESGDLDLIENTFQLVDPAKLQSSLKRQAFDSNTCLKIAANLKRKLDPAGQQRLQNALKPSSQRGRSSPLSTPSPPQSS